MKKHVAKAVGFLAPLLYSASSLAQEAQAGTSDNFSAAGAGYLAAGLAVGIAAAGGALGQGRTAAAALEGISRNPSAVDRMQTPLILGLAFIESLVLFVWGLSFLIFGAAKG